MKKLILITFILVSGLCYGQKDSTKPADSVAFISVKDLNEFLKALNKLPHEDFIKLTPQQTIQYLYQYGIDVWTNRKKLSKN